MSDPVQSFELILNKQCKKKSPSLYSETVKQKQSCKPKDVISSVFHQLKAIQHADSSKSYKRTTKHLQKYKSSTFTSVNNLSLLDAESPKQTSKFDTQCISDTQLMNVIEDAEILEAHQGMTQEFETTFLHTNTEHQGGNIVDRNCKDIVKETHVVSGGDKNRNNIEEINFTREQLKVETHNNSTQNKILEFTSKVDDNIKSSDLSETELNDLNNVTQNTETNLNNDTESYKIRGELLSQVLVTKTINFKRKTIETPILNHKTDNKDENNSEAESQFDQDLEINNIHTVDRPSSPIFSTKNIRLKSKSPSPLVFNLDQFEQFETIALSLLESEGCNIRKHVVNSQILHKELCFNMNKEMESTDSDVGDPKIQEKLGIDVDKEVIEMENANSKKIDCQNQNTQDGKNKIDTTNEILKDEILFSSDEEEDLVHKDNQDLPFTCALETSFYNQSDILDKTMYVGFQTASNRSIQICADSFARAKNILNDVISDEITTTELVNNCDSSITEKEEIDKEKECASILGQKAELSKISDLKLPFSNLVGFTTASNKKIDFSKEAFTRCKKVFQDIDLNEKFDCQTDEEDLHEKNKNKDKNNKESEGYNCDTEKAFTNYCKNPVDNVGFDEEIAQEFENIEMSLDDLKIEKAVTVPSNTLKIKLTVTPSEVVCDNIEEISEDVEFHESLNENISKENNITDNILSQILGNHEAKTHKSKNIVDNKINHNTQVAISEPERNDTGDVNFKTVSENVGVAHNPMAVSNNNFKDYIEKIPKAVSSPDKYPNSIEVNMVQPSTSTGFVGFKTANNKNIKISKKAWCKSKDVFNNIDSLKLPIKENKDYPNFLKTKKNPNHETQFEGFKTASNKNIEISNESFANTINIFNDININDLLSKKQDVIDLETKKELSEVKPKQAYGFVGFKSASNKIIKVSEKAMAQSKNIFKDIDEEFSKPHLKENQEDQGEIKTHHSNKYKGISEISTERMFVGFKTASNNNIPISRNALAKTRDIFKDVDAEFSKAYLKENQEDQGEIKTHSNLPKFIGFKTASRKIVQISQNALAKTRDIFKDIDSSNFKVPNVSRKVYPGFDENESKNTYKSEKEIINIGIENTKAKQLMTNDNPELEELLENCTNIRQNINNEWGSNPIKTPNSDSHVDCRPTSPIFNKPSGLRKPADAKSPGKHKGMFDDGSNRKTGNNSINIGFVGFHTANNKQVIISEKALANSKKIFQDLDSRNDFNVQNTITKAKTLYPQEIFQENEGSIQEIDALSNIKNKFTVTSFKGFQTASENPVVILESALEKSKNLFRDIDEASLKAINSCGLENDKTSDLKIVTTAEGLAFKGFQTASHQKVNVSKESLVKAKQLFRDIEIENSEEKVTVNPSHLNVGFQTGNNKAIAVSEDSLAKSKRLYSELEEECFVNVESKKEKKMHKSDDIDAMLDTQVIHNFEETLYTEDFAESPKNTKRSGSPILSCPRAKRTKKFEVPYNLKLISKPISKPIEKSTAEYSKITYRGDYKKKTTCTLKDLYNNMSKNISKPIDPYFCNFKYDNLLQFEFNHERSDLSFENMTIDLLKQEFLNSVNAKLIPDGWVDNHLRLILWKLISYEVMFKSVLVCSAKNVMEQLKFRYDKELYNAQRPALRKIYEKDDLPSKTLVLCVVGIYVDDVLVSSVSDTTSNVELLLTDGWYSIRCKIDKMLTQIVCSGKLCAGSKIATSGAELIGCEQGVSPWEDTSAIRLKISGNSTRRARWDAKLGYHPGTVSSQLSSIQVIGGKVSRLRVLVTRVYPALYIEKFEDGSTVTRSERLENIHQMKTEAERQAFMEKIYEEVEKEFLDQASQDSESLSESYKRTYMDSGSQIAKMMKQSKDPAEFRAQLTDSQLHLLEAHTSKNRDRLLQDIQARVRDRIEKAGVCLNRNVVSLLKIRVAGVTEKGDNVEVSKGMMSIWKPNEAIQEVIKEGAWIDVMNVIPTAVRYSEIQISASRQSVFNTSKYKEPDKLKPYTKLLQRQWYTIKDLAQNPSMTTDYNEIDTVGLIFLIDPSIKEFNSTKQSFQNVYLADADKKIICANFWGGLQKFGFQNVLDTGQILACVNLQKRAGNTRKSIPQFRVTEFSYFTQTPKNVAARKMIEEFNKKLNGLDRRKFCQDCVTIRNSFSYTKNNENISPYRCMNNTDINMSKNKVFIDSPLIRPNKIDDNFNLTGLDFESTFKQDSQLSEEMLQRKKKVNEKIARLRMYGEPPPLSPIHIINRNKQASSSYKSPLISNNNSSNIVHNNTKIVKENSNLKTLDSLRNKSDSSLNVTSVEITPQKCGVQNEVIISPVLLNRTYVKIVNPVKINFDVQENNDSVVDHFAEEFEGSPPLSLD